jgi:hypothetical protein
MHIEDLKSVLPQLGFDYRMEAAERGRSASSDGRVMPRAPRAEHWVELCPGCKRASIGAAQILAGQASMADEVYPHG